MTRCVWPLQSGRFAATITALQALGLALVLWATAVTAHAQASLLRLFPATALRGELLVTQPPEILLNQRPARLAPGARLRSTDNLLLLSGQVVGQRLVVHYTLDSLGQLLDVWVLTSAEMARKPWPTSPEQAANWVFNADAQTWSPR